VTTCERCPCGSADVRLYAEGWRCPSHTPAARAGKPEPDSKRYCAPARCYCGRYPSWTPDTAYHDGATVADARAIASGRRRASLTAYRDAQAQVHGTRPGSAA
jgi:hypothetical protein